MRHILPAAAIAAGLLAFVSATAVAQEIPFFASMNGHYEVNAAGVANSGDLDGVGSATILRISNSVICFGIAVDNITVPTAAHIHEAPAGVNGPIRVTLVAPTFGNPGASSGCVGQIDPVLLARIRATPSNFYVNVHTGQFPGGAVRGQLF